MKFNSSNEIWDEHQWETHITQAEQKSEEIRHFLDKTFGDEGPRWVKILKESESEHDALDAFIEEELMFDEAYLPDDDDDWDADDLDDEDFFFGEHTEEDSSLYTLDDLLTDRSRMDDDDDDDDDDADTKDEDSDEDDEFEGLGFDSFDDGFDSDDLDDFDDPDMEDGEEWKLLSDDYTLSDYGSIDNLAVYNQAHNYGAHMLMRSAGVVIDDAENRELFNLFVSDVLQISAKITAGYSLGFESDMLGGNIAYCKRGLQASNRALTTLQLLKKRKIEFGEVEYRQLHADLTSIRNDLGIYIQDLRELFRNEG